MADTSVSLILGTYTFDPVPTVTIQKEFVRTAGDCPVTINKVATFTGVLIITDKLADQTPINLITQMNTELCKCDECTRMTLICGTDTILDARVKVVSIEYGESQDNWTQTVPITVQVRWNVGEELDSTGDCTPCLQDFTESWSFQPVENLNQFAMTTMVEDPMNPGSMIEQTCATGPAYIQISRNLNATATKCCTMTTDNTQNPPVVTEECREGWQVAKDWVCARLAEGITSLPLANTVVDPNDQNAMIKDDCVYGDFNFTDPTMYSVCNHSRSLEIDECGGTYDVTETWLVANSGTTNPCTEEWTVSQEESRGSRLNSYSISGTVTGCEVRDASFTLTKTRLAAAKECWATIQTQLADRISCCYDLPCPLNTVPITYSVTISPGAGTIQYQATYDDSPISFVEGAISETITINDTKSSEVISEIPIIARTAGPILFSCGTQQTKRKSVNISVVFPYNAGNCPDSTGTACDRWTTTNTSIADIETKVEQFLCIIEDELIQANDFVARTQDTCSTSVIDCQYSRNVEWTYQSCADTLPTPFAGGTCCPDP